MGGTKPQARKHRSAKGGRPPRPRGPPGPRPHRAARTGGANRERPKAGARAGGTSASARTTEPAAPPARVEEGLVAAPRRGPRRPAPGRSRGPRPDLGGPPATARGRRRVVPPSARRTRSHGTAAPPTCSEQEEEEQGAMQLEPKWRQTACPPCLPVSCSCSGHSSHACSSRPSACACLSSRPPSFCPWRQRVSPGGR